MDTPTESARRRVADRVEQLKRYKHPTDSKFCLFLEYAKENE